MKNLLIVNQLSSAKYLSDSLKNTGRDINSIGLYGNLNDLDEYTRPSPEYFNHQIILNSLNMDEAIANIKEPIDYVINGSEQSLFLSEKLASRLTPKYFYNLETTALRCDKILQQIAMKNNGLSYIKQVQINLENINTSLIDSLEYPIFAKPVNGAASIGVFMANSPAELIKKLKFVPKKILGKIVVEYLIQEYITGLEVVIDSFSVQGQHFISNVYSYTKEIMGDGTPLYRSAQNLVDPEIRSSAINFAINCLNACQVSNGFAHIELFMIAKDNFRLIELNPRISGGSGILNRLTKYLGGISQEQMLINLLLEREIDHNLNDQSTKYGKIIFLYDHKPFDKKLYHSYRDLIKINHEPLQVIPGKSPSLIDTRQFILCVSDDQKLLDSDVSSIISNDII